MLVFGTNLPNARFLVLLQTMACYAAMVSASRPCGLEIVTSRLNCMNKAALVVVRKVDLRMLFIRGQKVILDADLAELYAVLVKRLNGQVKRNARRFPSDFIFSLSRAEYENLRSQFATSSFAWRTTLPAVCFDRTRCDHGGTGVELQTVLSTCASLWFAPSCEYVQPWP
jgi:ORF6N domain